MELFSLEEDEGNELFITQTPSEKKDEDKFGGILGDPMDFSSPCKSVIGEGNNTSQQYSDISDDENFDIPSSQMQVDSHTELEG